MVNVAAVSQPRAEPSDGLGLRLLRGRRGHGGLVLRIRVLPAAALITAVHLLLVGFRLSRSWWWQDDLNILATAAHRPLSLHLLFSDYNGHLIPGSWAVAWVFDRVAALQWWPAALLTLIVVAVTDVMLLALLHRLFTARPAILLPYAMYCSTSLTLTGTLWWAAAMEWLPVTLALVTALWFHVGYLKGRRRGDAIGVLAAVLGGLLFFEKALIIPIVLAGFTVGYGVPGPLWRRPWRALRGYWRYWLAQGVLAGGYLWFYLSRVRIDTGNPTQAADIVTTARLMIMETLLPSLIGGPLRWFTNPGTNIGAWPRPALWLVIVASILTGAAVIGSVLLVRGAWRAWVLLAVFLGISVALVTRTRLGFVGTFIGRDQRYLTDAAVLAPLCLALAWLPLRPGLDAAARSEPDSSPHAGSGRRQRLRAALSRHRDAVTAIAVVAILVMTAGGVVSGEQFMNSWSKNPSQRYIENLSAGLATHPGPVYLFGDETVPDQVMTPTFLDQRQIGHVTRPMAVRPRVQPAVPYFSVVDKAGNLHDGTVRGTNAVIPRVICGSENQPAIIPLPNTPGPGLWKLRLGYSANRQTTALVSIGNQSAISMRLDRGLHQVYVSLRAGDSSQIRLSGIDHDAAVCVGTATIGFPVAAS